MSSLIGRELAELPCSVSGPRIGRRQRGSETLQRPEMLGGEGAHRMPVLDSVLPTVVNDHAKRPLRTVESMSARRTPTIWLSDPMAASRTGSGVGGYLRPTLSDVRTAGSRFAAGVWPSPTCRAPAAVDRYWFSGSCRASPGGSRAFPATAARRGISRDVRDF